MRTAVIGGGLAGLACARALAARGRNVVIFDRGRDVGGRMSARRLDTGGHADHGCRGFSARDERFAAEVGVWVDTGLAASWSPRLAMIDAPGEPTPFEVQSPRFVGTPTMHAPVRAIAATIEDRVEIRRKQDVRAIHRTGHTWTVCTAEEDIGPFDEVALATPASTAATLLAEVPHLRAAALSVPMTPCWAAIIRFDDRLPLEFDAASVLIGGRHAHAGVLAWMDRESSKPGRAEDEVWVLHAAEDWAREQMDTDRETVGARMIDAFFEATGLSPVAPAETHAHRWRSAFPVAPLCDGCLYDEGLNLGACGDWCMGARVEGAYLSGIAMAARLLGEHSDFLAPVPCNRTAR